MIRKHAISQIPNSTFRQLGWDFLISEEIGEYIVDELVLVSERERDAFYEAANELYDVLVDAAQYVIDHKLYDELDIPPCLVELIEYSWEDDRHLHLFGRFDFAGGVDGLPIKLLEFNADTPTSLPETAIIQWAQLKANNLAEEQQFNFVYDALVENFQRLLDENADLAPRLLVSTMRETPEDENNVSVLIEAAREAGFEVEFAYVDEVIFSAEDGIFRQADDTAEAYDKFDFWFKLVPWEYIGREELELAELLTKIVKKRKAVIINPAYTLLLQSKGLLKYAWDRNKQHPLLLPTSFDKPVGTAHVKKVMLGREGSDVTIFDEKGEIVDFTQGDYAEQPSIYQGYAQLATDERGHSYQAGVFFAWEGCGLGFRRNATKILDNAAQFVGHYIGDIQQKASRNKFFS